jgi:hypothetical protein
MLKWAVSTFTLQTSFFQLNSGRSFGFLAGGRFRASLLSFYAFVALPVK